MQTAIEEGLRLLASIDARLARLEAVWIAGRDTVSTLSRGDRERLAAILPAIGGALGSELFLTRELLASPAPAVQLVLRGLNAKQLGRLFRRADRHAIDGYSIQRESTELGAILWRVVRVDGFPRVSNLAVLSSDKAGRSC